MKTDTLNKPPELERDGVSNSAFGDDAIGPECLSFGRWAT